MSTVKAFADEKQNVVKMNGLNDEILVLSKFQAFADNASKVDRMLKLAFNWAENIVGIGENADYQHFLLFPQCFQKASIPVS